MLYEIADFLSSFWGPLRILKSHVFLISGAAVTAALAVFIALPRFWNLLPRDRGKAICSDVGGNQSAGKPTGAGVVASLAMLPSLLLFAPLAFWDLMCITSLYAAMVFGYLDDRATKPWGESLKLVLDIAVSVAIAVFLFAGHSEETGSVRTMTLWMPFVKGVWHAPFWVWIPSASAAILFTLNATNCSDGVDGLAGTLTFIELVMLAVVLYLVVGYRPVADYFLIPPSNGAAGWAVTVTCTAGALAGYLWYNAEPSKVLMGDAGSRFLGALIAAASLMTGNLFFVVALAPVILLNGGGGLVKLLFLRTSSRIGCEIPEDALIKRIRFPLHDHCKKKLGWSNAQVLMRFTLIQLLVMPVLLLLLIKVR